MAKDNKQTPENAGAPATNTTAKSRAFRAGGYSIIVSVVVIAIAIVVNMLVGRLPATATQLDITPGQLFELGDQTKSIVGGLQNDVSLYWLVQSGQEDSFLQQTLDRYASLSGKIHVEKKDPVVHPNFATQYTSDQLYNNSLIVVNGERSKYVSYNDIFTINYSADGSSANYQYEGESAITSAIDYVTSDNIPVVYILQGHGELTLDSAMRAAVQKQNITFQNLNLLSNETIPEDADALFILSPQRDISAEEKTAIEAYLAGGGDLLLMTDYIGETLPNLEGLMAHYGVEKQDGIIMEGNSARSLRGTPYYLLPQMTVHDITSPLIGAGYYVLLPVAQGLTVTGEARETLLVTEILKTTDQSFSKLAGVNLTTFDKEDGDIDGPFAVGVAITETIGDVSTNLVWYTTSELLSSSNNTMVAGGNQDLFVNTIAWMCEREQSIAIHAKSLAAEQLTVPSATGTVLSVVLIGVVPIALIAIGVLILVRRRRR